MPRTILTRYKVKPSKLCGELTYPFDLAVFGMVEITKLLRTDFTEMFANLEYNGKIWVKKNTADLSNNCIEFHHEKNLTKQDKYKLTEIYLKRIENFRNVVNENKPVIFFQISSDMSEIINQYDEIYRLREGKSFKFLIVNTGENPNYTRKTDLDILNLPFPCETYKREWWNKKYYNTPYGREFEKTIADFCKKHISEL